LELRAGDASCSRGVLSFDDLPWTSDFEPRLTAIAQPAHEMGRRDVSLLSAMDWAASTQRSPPVRLSLSQSGVADQRADCSATSHYAVI